MKDELRLVPRTREEVRASIDAMDASVKAQLSADWLALFRDSSAQDPWVHGFNVLHPDFGAVGLGAFKGPPRDGVVEIAYAIVPEHQRKGYATQVARALFEYAAASGQVRSVIAHALPTSSASQRVLAKAGFTFVGEFVDPEDGPVWRYDRTLQPGA